MEAFIWAVIAVIFFIAAIAGFLNKRSTISELGPIAKFDSGKYLGGLPGQVFPTSNTIAVISTDTLSFLNAGGNVLGKIPFGEIISYDVDDKSQALQRLTATRIAALGVFALAAPKTRKQEEFLLHVQWQTNDEEEHHAIFEIEGVAARIRANAAGELLRQHVKIAPRKAAERKCPFCAESIKVEAILCKHCRSEIPLLK